MKRNYTVQELIDFETKVKEAYEAGQIKGPVHLSKNNEEQLIELFKNINEDDWVFSAWRNHYHALLHGVDPEYLFKTISEGKSMGTNNVKPNFYASSIVGGIIPIALGVAQALKLKNSPNKVWCFIGDMTMETGGFWEAYKYSQNFELPLQSQAQPLYYLAGKSSLQSRGEIQIQFFPCLLLKRE